MGSLREAPLRGTLLCPKFQAVTQRPQCVQRVIHGLAFVSIVTRRRREFSPSQDKRPFSFGNARGELLLIGFRNGGSVQFAPALDTCGRRG